MFSSSDVTNKDMKSDYHKLNVTTKKTSAYTAV